ncbi:hypothetical protein ACFYXC_33810 [Streptomyces sp. NPDC002701]|uniref:hypothetical protein n=1 Tax=Streptomyces sp. NPDC002701 TaxID=3364661 RepID=UPI0036C93BAE
MVSKDQLDQSQEDSQRDRRAQASRVNYWITNSEKKGDKSLHVLNRSLDPIRMTIYFEVLVVPPTEFIHAQVIAGSIDMAPCTEWIYDVDALRYSEVSGGAPNQRPKQGVTLNVRAAVFLDRDGIRWVRRDNELQQLKDRVPTAFGVLRMRDQDFTREILWSKR